MSKIVSIHSFRGGTGKSNTTANLASLIAVAGKRVAVVDTDIQSPGIHVLFGLDEHSMGHTLNEYLYGETEIEKVAYNLGDHVDDAPGRSQLRGKHMWLVPGSMNTGDISKVLRNGYDVNVLNKGIRNLRRSLELDFLFIDTHPGLNEETLLSIAISDVLIIILRPDNQDFQGTAVTVDIARSLDVPNLRLVVNKALASRYDLDNIQEQVTNTFQAKVSAVLPLSEDLVDMASGDIFALRYPEHEWSKRIKAVADDLLDM